MTDQPSFFRRAYDAMMKARMAQAEEAVARYRHLHFDAEGRPYIQDPGR